MPLMRKHLMIKTVCLMYLQHLQAQQAQPLHRVILCQLYGNETIDAPSKGVAVLVWLSNILA
jgi:hypothetical protein